MVIVLELTTKSCEYHFVVDFNEVISNEYQLAVLYLLQMSPFIATTKFNAASLNSLNGVVPTLH